MRDGGEEIAETAKNGDPTKGDDPYGRKLNDGHEAPRGAGKTEFEEDFGGMNGRPWTKKEVRMLRKQYPDTPTWKLEEILGRTRRSIYGQATKMKLNKSKKFLESPFSGRMRPGDRRGEPTRFKPGHVSFNKGKKGWSAGGRSVETRFKKGNRPQTWRPIGSIRITKGDILQIKVTDTGSGPRDWRSVHGLLWEGFNGPIPKGHIVVFQNGNTRDFRIENLELITRAENMRRNSIHRMPAPLAEVCRTLGRLHRYINHGGRYDKKQNRRSPGSSVRNHRKAA